jgi:Flp pilus assembly CpaE family ATPase
VSKLFDPLLVALAINEPEHEALFLRMVQDTAFTIGGQPCEVVRLCASVFDLEQVLTSGSVDVVVVSSQLGAIPFAHLVALAHCHVRMVVTAQDPTDRRWDEFPGGLVIGTHPTADQLAQALSGDRAAIAGWRAQQANERGRATRETRLEGAAPPARSIKSGRKGKVITVAGAYQPSGKSLVAVGLTRALGVPARCVLVDADLRFGTTPFTLGMSVGYSLCQLAEKQLRTAEAWDTALESELRAMDSSQALVLAGVPRPKMRPAVTPAFYERLVEALAERFAYTVLDTSGTGWSPADSPIDALSLRLADQILLVVRPDPKGVDMAREALREWAGSRDRIGLVLNQAGQRGMESRGEVEVVLGLGVVAVIPFDPAGVAAASRRRRPIVTQSGAKAAAPLLDLAGRLHGGGPIALPPDVEPPVARHWWHRLAPAAVGGVFRW